VNYIDVVPGLKEILDKSQEDIQKILGRPVTVNYKINKHKHSFDDLTNAVCLACEITLPELKSNSRIQKLVIARQIFCWFGYNWCKFTVTDIGLFIGRDHSTVIVSREKVNDMMDINDQEYMQKMELVRMNLLKK